MKMVLVTRDHRIALHLPHEAADHAIANGPCPKCGAANFGVQGSGRRPRRRRPCVGSGRLLHSLQGARGHDSRGAGHVVWRS